MPSLSELGQFKSSFNNIAKEREDIESLSMPFDDFPLPGNEAPPFNPAADDLNDAPPPMDTPSGGAIGALDDFLSDLTTGGTQEPEADAGVDDGLADLLGGGLDEPAAEEAAPDDDGLAALLGGGFDEPVVDDEPAVEEEPAAEEPAADDDGLAALLNGGFDEPAAEESTADDGLADLLGGGFDEPAAEEAATDDGLADLLGGGFDESAPEEPAAEEGDAGDLADFGTDDFNIDNAAPEETPLGDDFGLGDDDLGGSIDMGGESPVVEAAAPDDLDFDLGTATLDDSSFDLGTASDESPADIPAPSEEAANSSIDMGGEIQDLDLGGESLGDDFSFPSDLPGEGADDELPAFDEGAAESSFDEAPLEDSSLGDDFADFDMGAAPSAEPEGSAPLHDLGDLGDDFSSDSIDLPGESSEAPAGADDFGDSSFDSGGGGAFGDSDFDLDGLDDILNKSKATSTVITPPPKKSLFGRKKEKPAAQELPEAEDSVEEISLSQEDVDKLLKTLQSYPLNLRIACEELIAEQVILPQQLSMLIRLLVYGANVKETAAHVESITGKPIIIPKSFEKSTGAAFEAEQSSFAYIFIHNFLPVFRLIAIIAAVLLSVMYLSYNFIYIPIKAEGLYKRGYDRIPAGEYQRANELFQTAFQLHKKKKWFYAYAEAFRDQRRYTLAEGKYDELLLHYPRDKKGVLDYADLNTNYLMNYEKANRLLQRELLDYAPDDKEGLLAAGDNFLAWADSNPARFFDKYEDARFCFARWLELYGWQPNVVERVLKYFIRTDDLKQVLKLRVWFESDPKRDLSAGSLAELGGYLLDKQLEKPKGVPNPYVENIESVRDMLLRAMRKEPNLPEPHYHLARYHKNLNNTSDERKTLENAIRAFDIAKQESVRRRLYRVDAYYRYANLLVDVKEFFPAEANVVRGIELYEDYLNRNLVPGAPALGKLYGLWGDLEYFVKTGNMEAALSHYHKAEDYGYAPPEIQYRMGSAYYKREDWRNALDYLFKASADLPLNRRMLFALGNAAYQRGDYFASQGYYNRLLDILELQRLRLPVLLPNDNVQFLETGERLMMARNNLGVVNEALAAQTGNREYRSKAMVMYAESARAWDAITRNPESMTRMSLTDSPGAPSINLGYLNANNALRPNSSYRPEIFVRIDRDVLEPSKWEELAPFGGF